MAPPLKGKRCTPCEGGIPPLSRPQAEALLVLVPGFSLDSEARRLTRSFLFPDFKQALAFADKIGAIAEEEGHHPELTVRWGECVVRLWTIKIDGLHENDFILAAKINEVAGDEPSVDEG